MPGRAPFTRSDLRHRVAPFCACLRKRFVRLFPYPILNAISRYDSNLVSTQCSLLVDGVTGVYGYRLGTCG